MKDNTQKEDRKPIKAKPQFYAVCLQPLQEIAREMGYNLIIHGSMSRDMDLVAIPWVDKPEPELKLIQSFDRYLRHTYFVAADEGEIPNAYIFSVLPGGRRSYVINLNRGGGWNNYTDEQYYLDISITPLPTS